MLIQFRMNINYFNDEQQALEDYRCLRRHLLLFQQTGLQTGYWFTWLAAEQMKRLDPELLKSHSNSPAWH